MKYFLVKADPETDYSIQDLERDHQTIWDGVHNFQAINFIKIMRPGDQVLIYHSQKQKSVVGLAEVSGKPFKNVDDPRFSWAVRLRFDQIFDNPIPLAEIKAEESLKDFLLVRNGRLSVMPVEGTTLTWFKRRLGI